MSKTRDTGNISNVVKVDASGNVSFVSGSTTLATINTTGQLSGSSPVLSSSYASNAELLDGLDSTVFTLTSSFIAQTASFTAFTASINAFSASQNSFTASILAQTSSLNTFSASVLTYQTNLNLKTASFATTGSNDFTAVQHIADTTNPTGFDTTASLYTEGGLGIKKDTYISSSLYIKGNLTVYGTQSVNYITSSQLNISTNIITVNTSTPSIRFGGLAVQDSGSAGGLTGSLLWDSQNNSWLYNNPSGSGNYDSSLVIMGPRNSSTLGNEAGLSCNYLVQGHGHHHTTSSAIFHDGSTTCLPGAIIGGTMSGTTIYGSSVVCSPVGLFSGCVGIGTTSPAELLEIAGSLKIGNLKIQNVNGGSIGFNRNTANGAIYNCCYAAFQINGPLNGTNYLDFQNYNSSGSYLGSFVFKDGNFGIGTTNPGAQLEVMSTTGGTLRLKRDDTSVTTDEVMGTVEFYTNDGDGPHVTSYIKGLGADFGGSNYGRYGAMSFGVSKTANTDAVEAMRIDLQGAIGIGITSPKSVLDVATTSVGDNVASTLTLSAITNAAYGQCAMIQAFVNDSGNAECANIGSIQFIKQRPAGNSIGGDMIFSTRFPGASGMSSPTERMRITNCGKIGIGATNPLWLLEVCCNTTATGGGGYPAIAINNPNDIGYSALYFFKGANNFGGLEFSNTTCHLFVNTICTFAIQTNNIERLRVNNNGYISIGANTPIAPLAVYVCGPTTSTPTVQFVSYCGSGSQVYTTIGGSDSWHGIALRGVPAAAADWSITAGNQMSFFEYGSDFRFYQKQPASMALHVQFYGGTIYALSTSIVSLSDCRLKENIREIGYGLNEIIQLKPKMFDWKEGHGTCVKDNLGFMAQDVETLLPELVTEWSHTEGVEAYKTLKMGDMIPVLVKGMQEQQCTICSQAGRIRLLETCLGIA